MPEVDHISKFITHIRTELQLSANTVEAYQRDLLQWQEFATESGRYELRPDTTTINDLRLWISSLSSAKDSPRTLRRKIQSLRAFFRYMMKYEGMQRNPAAELRPPKIPHQLPVYVRTEEMQQMLNEDIDTTDFIQVRNHLILEMFYATGLRCTELISLLDANVDCNRGELKVHGKRNKDRIVPFGPGLKTMIESYRNLRQQTCGSSSAGEFFIRPDGQPLYRKLVYNIVHSAMELNVHASRKSPHVMRHSFATDMLNGGADLTTVQQLLGHQSLNATQIYTHISYRDLKQNYELAHPRAQKKGG